MAGDASKLLADLEARLRPAVVALAHASWAASTHVSAAANYRRAAADLERRAVLADPDAFAAIVDARTDSDLDPAERRQLDLLHDAYAPHPIPEDMRRRLVQLETSVDSTFN